MSSRGCNRLLGRGAVAFSETEEILLDLGINSKKVISKKTKELKGDTKNETLILEKLGEGVSDGEEILERILKSGIMMNVSEFTTTVFDLQIKGRIKAMGGNRWLLVN